MARVKTFDATGLDPGGRLYAGDLNAIQDAKADVSNYAQVVDVGTLRLGEAAIGLSRFGAGEANLSAALRLSGAVRAAQGVLPGPLTTAQRDALTSAQRPTGMAIFNSTTNSWEYNAGSATVPSWQPLVSGAAPGGTAGGDLTGNFPNPQIAAGAVVNADVNAAAAIAYSKLALTGQIVNADISGAAALAPSKIAGYPTDGTKYLAGDGTWKVVAGGAAGTAGGDLSGTYPNPQIASGVIVDADISASAAIGPSKIAGTAVLTADARLSDSRRAIANWAAPGDLTIAPGATVTTHAFTNFTTSGIYQVVVTWLSRHEVNLSHYTFREKWTGGTLLDWADMEAGYAHAEVSQQILTVTSGQAIWVEFFNQAGSGNLLILNLHLMAIRVG
jgi:hypothetical protein